MINKNKKFKFGHSYAVQNGYFAGEILIFIEKNEDIYCFLSIPNMENRDIPKEKIDFALDNDIIEYVEKVPRYVRNIARAKYKENKQYV